MKQKIAFFVALMAAVVVFTGCASIQKTEPAQLNGEKLSASGTPVAHLNAENWGIYFFMIPLITGSTDDPGSMEFLTDTVTVKNTANYLTREAKAMKATHTLDMTSQINVWGWWFYVRSVQVSANAIR